MFTILRVGLRPARWREPARGARAVRSSWPTGGRRCDEPLPPYAASALSPVALTSRAASARCTLLFGVQDLHDSRRWHRPPGARGPVRDVRARAGRDTATRGLPAGAVRADQAVVAVISVIEQAGAAGFRVHEEHEGLTQPFKPADGFGEGQHRRPVLAEGDRCGQRAGAVGLRPCLSEPVPVATRYSTLSSPVDRSVNRWKS